jgi:hypothetical protein
MVVTKAHLVKEEIQVLNMSNICLWNANSIKHKFSEIIHVLIEIKSTYLRLMKLKLIKKMNFYFMITMLNVFLNQETSLVEEWVLLLIKILNLL